VSALVGRGVGAVLCLVVAAWLASGLAPVRDQAAAVALVTGPRAPSPATVDRAERLLVKAAGATSSHEPDVRRAELLLFARRDQAAARVALDLVRVEPANVEGWTVLAQAAAASDPALAARARAHFRALSPRVAPARSG
jgi:hypothetical protein